MISMAPSLALLVLVAVLVGTGVTLVLERSLSRIVIGTCLITYGINVLLLMAGGRAGGPPILGQSEVEDMSDPLPQAMVLTAIVISLALSAFMLAMSYRTWQLNGNDEVQDDREDRRIALNAVRDTIAERKKDDSGESTEQSAEAIRDETEDLPVAEILAAQVTVVRRAEGSATRPPGRDTPAAQMDSGVIEAEPGVDPSGAVDRGESSHLGEHSFDQSASKDPEDRT